MATLGESNNPKFMPQGNTPKPGIITPKTKIIARRTDTPTTGNEDPSHK